MSTPIRHAPCLLLWLCACAAGTQGQGAAQRSPEQTSIRVLEERIENLEKDQRELARQALCPREVRRLMEDGRRECTPGSACSNPEIGLFVNDADPRHEGRFLSLMDSQDHRAVYFKGKVPTPPASGPKDAYLEEGHKAIGDKQLKRLRRLLQPQLLSTTQFLVVSHPGERRDKLAAEQRGSLVIDTMLEIGKKERIDLRTARILHWIYPFAIQRGEKMRAEDRPPPGYSLGQSVWVFRVDC